MLCLVILLAALIIFGAAPAHARGRHPGLGMPAVVAAAALRHGVPPKLALAIASVESGFDPRARNGRSVGLMQVQPGTARDAGCRGALGEPAANADCGARVLAILLRHAGGDCRRAAARYNAGRFARGGAGSRYAALVLSRARRVGT